MFPDGSIDLVYLDPPFNSNANYNVLFKETSGESSQAQFHAFTDTWEWTREVDDTYRDFVDTCPNASVVELVEALKKFLKTSPMMAYLAMMAPRLVELHRVLKPTGSLYLHCDPTASHYLRLVLDSIFGGEHFRNEIIWQRTAPKGHAFTRYPSTHDTLLYYAKGSSPSWDALYLPHKEELLQSHYNNVEEGTGRRYTLDNCMNPNPNRPNLTYEWHGHVRVWRWTRQKMQELHDQGRLIYTRSGLPRFKRYLDEMKGTPVTSIWIDIPPINSQAQERLGYPTQKPQALLERIINASCPKDGIVLDPFCGCGTTVHAAQKLGRRWIGIDVTYLAINLIKRRLRDAFGEDVQFEEMGQPTDFESAKRLAEMDKWQFQQWALSIIHARPRHEGEGKGADRGVDGLLYFYESKDDRRPILVQVKGGSVKRDDVATLLGDVNNQKAPAACSLRWRIRASRW